MTHKKEDEKNDNFTVEMKLILLCSKVKLTENDKKDICELLKQPIKWDEFLESVNKNRVYPIVYLNLKNIQNNNIDRTVLLEMEKLYKKNQMKSLQMSGELIRLMDLFEKNEIQAISIKGPLLGFYLYDDISMRTSRDLDIIVDYSNIDKVEKLLQKEGYKNLDIPDLSKKQKQFFMKETNHISFKNKTGIIIELHWKYYSGIYELPFVEAWKKCIKCNISNKAINILNNEENFLYLTFHGSKHAWKRLRWICDIRDIVEKFDLDWKYIQQRADALGISFMLIQTIELLQILFNIKIDISYNGNNKKPSKLTILALPFIENNDDNSCLTGCSLYMDFKKYVYNWNKGILPKIKHLKGYFHPSMQLIHTVNINDKYFFAYYIIAPLYKIKNIIVRKHNTH